MANKDIYNQLLSILLKEWRTKKGLVVGLFIILLIFLPLKNISLNVKLTLFAIISIVFFLYWVITTNRVLLFRKKINIAFAVRVEDESQNYYREIRKEFNRQIEAYKLSKIIKILDLAQDVYFDSNEKAEKFATNKDINLLVWGSTTEGNWNNKFLSRFNLKFSFFHFLSKKSKSKVLSELSNLTRDKKWIVGEPSSYIDASVIANNTTEIALLILGFSLASFPDFSSKFIAIEIFEDLINGLNDRKEEDFPDLQKTRKIATDMLKTGYPFLSRYLWEKKENKERAKEFAKKAIEIDNNNHLPYENLAFFAGLERNISLAKKYNQKILNIYPASRLARFNLAFFNILDKKYEEALRIYERTTPQDLNPVQIIDFIENYYDEEPMEHGLLFAAGILNLKYADDERGLKQLKKFIEITKEDNSYIILIKKSEELIGNAKE